MKVVATHVEGNLKVGVAQMLLQIAPVQVGREFKVGGEEHVQRVGFVLAGKYIWMVVTPAIQFCFNSPQS